MAKVRYRTDWKLPLGTSFRRWLAALAGRATVADAAACSRSCSGWFAGRSPLFGEQHTRRPVSSSEDANSPRSQLISEVPWPCWAYSQTCRFAGKSVQGPEVHRSPVWWRRVASVQLAYALRVVVPCSWHWFCYCLRHCRRHRPLCKWMRKCIHFSFASEGLICLGELVRTDMNM